MERDAHGNVARDAKDYRGISYTVLGPSPVCRLDDNFPRFSSPFILAPLDFLSIPNSSLCFTSAPMTGYKKYWSDYPKRRLINPVNQTRSDRYLTTANASVRS